MALRVCGEGRARVECSPARPRARHTLAVWSPLTRASVRVRRQGNGDRAGRVVVQRPTGRPRPAPRPGARAPGWRGSALGASRHRIGVFGRDEDRRMDGTARVGVPDCASPGRPGGGSAGCAMDASHGWMIERWTSESVDVVVMDRCIDLYRSLVLTPSRATVRSRLLTVEPSCKSTSPQLSARVRELQPRSSSYIRPPHHLRFGRSAAQLAPSPYTTSLAHDASRESMWYHARRAHSVLLPATRCVSGSSASHDERVLLSYMADDGESRGRDTGFRTLRIQPDRPTDGRAATQGVP